MIYVYNKYGASLNEWQKWAWFKEYRMKQNCFVETKSYRRFQLTKQKSFSLSSMNELKWNLWNSSAIHHDAVRTNKFNSYTKASEYSTSIVIQFSYSRKSFRDRKCLLKRNVWFSKWKRKAALYACFSIELKQIFEHDFVFYDQMGETFHVTNVQENESSKNI